MPRFHFHIRTASEFIVDDEGVEIADCGAAVIEAVRGARCLMKGEVGRGTLCLDQSIEIHDAFGEHLRTVPFTEALTVVHETAAGQVIAPQHLARE